MNTMTPLKICICLASALMIGNALATSEGNHSRLADVSMNDTNAKDGTEHAAKDDLNGAKSYLSDAEITAKVKEKFISEKLFGKEKISAMGIHVKTHKGVVHLRGKVTSKEQEDNAIALAKSVKGVNDVKSTIKIVEPKKKEPKTEATH